MAWRQSACFHPGSNAMATELDLFPPQNMQHAGSFIPASCPQYYFYECEMKWRWSSVYPPPLDWQTILKLLEHTHAYTHVYFQMHNLSTVTIP